MRQKSTVLMVLALLIASMGIGLTGCSNPSGGGTVPPAPQTGKSITAFLIGDVEGDIDEDAHTITVELPHTTSDFTVTMELSPGATVRAKTAENFSGVTVYTVTAEDTTSVDYTATVIRKGGISSFGTPDDGADLFPTPAAIVLSKGGANTTAAITANQNYDEYWWYADNELKGTGFSITLDAADYSVGKHRLVLVAARNLVAFSKEVTFTVNN